GEDRLQSHLDGRETVLHRAAEAAGFRAHAHEHHGGQAAPEHLQAGQRGTGDTGPADRSAALDKKMLADLPKELGGQHAVEYAQGKVIMSAGASGALMYVVTKGRV